MYENDSICACGKCGVFSEAGSSGSLLENILIIIITLYGIMSNLCECTYFSSQSDDEVKICIVVVSVMESGQVANIYF